MVSNHWSNTIFGSNVYSFISYCNPHILILHFFSFSMLLWYRPDGVEYNVQWGLYICYWQQTGNRYKLIWRRFLHRKHRHIYLISWSNHDFLVLLSHICDSVLYVKSVITSNDIGVKHFAIINIMQMILTGLLPCYISSGSVNQYYMCISIKLWDPWAPLLYTKGIDS